MADVFTVVFVILGLWLALAALSLLLRAWWPAAVLRARDGVAARPWRALAIGAAVGAPGLIVVSVIGALPGAAKPLSGLLLSLLFLYGFVGVAGLATHVGERLASPQDAARAWLPTLRGAVCVEVAASLPLVGWFVIAPAALVMGLGGTTLALLGAAPAAAVEPAPGAAAVEPVPAAAVAEREALPA